MPDYSLGNDKNHGGVAATEAEVFDNRSGHLPQQYRGTSADQHDMTTLGKKQVLRVRYASSTFTPTELPSDNLI